MRIANALAGARLATFDAATAWRTLNTLDGRQLLQVESAFREFSWEFSPGSKGRTLAAAETATEPDRAAAYRFAAACSADGFERQAALEAIGVQPHRLDLAVALIRAQDWVPQVRDAARGARLEILWSPVTDLVFETFDLTVLLRARGRGGATDDVYESCLRGDLNRDRRWRLTRHRDLHCRQAAYELMLEVDADISDEVLLQACGDPSLGIALWALGQDAGHPVLGSLLDAADRHRHPAVRAQSLRLREQSHPDAKRLRDAVFDAARGVRNAAAYLLRTSHQEEALPLWRNAFDLASPPLADIAAAALAEHAEAVDVPRLQRLFVHASSRLRSMALHSLVRLKIPDLPEFLSHALDDPATRVRREAIRAYRSGEHVLDPALLEAVYLRAVIDSQRISLLNAAAALGKWDALAFLLARADDADETQFRLLAPSLERWREHANASYVTLSDARRAELLDALERAAQRHPGYRWETIHAMV